MHACGSVPIVMGLRLAALSGRRSSANTKARLDVEYLFEGTTARETCLRRHENVQPFFVCLYQATIFFEHAVFATLNLTTETLTEIHSLRGP